MTLPPILARRVPGAGRGGPPQKTPPPPRGPLALAPPLALAGVFVLACVADIPASVTVDFSAEQLAGVHGGCWPLRSPLLALQGKVHRVDPLVDPDFGSTLTVSNRDSHSNCWVNWKTMGQPCEFQVFPVRSICRRAFPVTDTISDPPDTVSDLRH
jgi:hypothetical protein